LGQRYIETHAGDLEALLELGVEADSYVDEDMEADLHVRYFVITKLPPSEVWATATASVLVGATRIYQTDKRANIVIDAGIAAAANEPAPYEQMSQEASRSRRTNAAHRDESHQDAVQVGARMPFV
jgi:hypothetical protein